MKLELVARKDVSYVELRRDKNHSFGFTVTDGTEDDSRPVVKSVKINSPAAKSFAVAKGDVILSVNGFSTTGKKSKDVRQMLDDAGLDVNLQVLYKTNETRILGSCVYKKQRLTLRLQKVKGGFGFLLRKCSKYSFLMEYPVLSNIVEGSPLCKRGQLQDGDRLLKIDDVNLSWMSLSYIASLLQAKDEAEFTFEYSVGVFNIADMDTKLDLEINVPVADLGISFCICDEECSLMYITDLRRGSIAERCGVFSEGDVILSIDGIDTKDLTVSKAQLLLRNARRCRKISFISNRRAIEKPNKNIGIFPSDSTISTDSFTSDIQTSDWKHLNTPLSSRILLDGHQQNNYQNFCYVKQIQSMDKFQIVLSNMLGLKQVLSILTRQAFTETPISVDQNCTSCNNTKPAVKLCTSCLARMNVKCAQSMDVLRDLVSNFVRLSSNLFDENDDQLFDFSLKNVIHMLRETLPNIFNVPELRERLSVLAEKMSCADTSCSLCNKEVKAAILISKQLLLILSIRENSAEFADIVEHLVCCLLDIKFPCCGDSAYILNSNDSIKRKSSYENLSETNCIGIHEEFASDTTSIHLKTNSETESNLIFSQRNFNTLQLNTEMSHDYLKLTHIQSLSESKNSVSVKNTSETKKKHESCTENHKTFPKEIVGQTMLSDVLTANNPKRFVKNLKSNNIQRSLNSLVKHKRLSEIQNSNQSRNQTTCNKNENTDTVVINQNTCNVTNVKNIVTDLNRNVKCASNSQSKITKSHDNCNETHSLDIKHRASGSAAYISSVNQPLRHHFSKYQKCISSKVIAPKKMSTQVFDTESPSSPSRSVADKRNAVESKETCSETNTITLKNEGDGFGLSLSDKTIINEIPVIEAIKPKSPAHKEGVLMLGDHILAINGVVTTNLTPEDFSALKNESLAARTITLTVEFHVNDEQYRFGCFDVVLVKTPKIGLIYEDKKNGNLLVIKGVAKGSAAHRSGQVFPGDEISFVQYKKKEVFDPLTNEKIKEKCVILTIVRDPKKVLGLKERVSEFSNMRAPPPTPINTDSYNSSSSCSYPSIYLIHQEDKLPCESEKSETNKDFVVKKTEVHQSSKNSVVIEHAVILYRDSIKCDFGILLAEHPISGRGYVKDIRPDGPAHKSGVIQKYDSIIEVNGVSVSRNVYELFYAAGFEVDLLIRRVYRGESDEAETKVKRIHE